jgi:hypothetical protein
MAIAITIEAENPKSPTTTFRLSINGAIVTTGLAGAEAHVVIGKLIERISLPKTSGQTKPAAAPTARTLPKIAKSPLLEPPALRAWLRAG